MTVRGETQLLLNVCVETSRGRRLAVRRDRAKRLTWGKLLQLQQERVRRCSCHRECDASGDLYVMSPSPLRRTTFPRQRVLSVQLVTFPYSSRFSYSGACHDAFYIARGL